MTPKEKAKRLVMRFKGVVYPYIGSSMLVNETNIDVIISNSKYCATVCVDEMIRELKSVEFNYDLEKHGSTSFE